MPATEVHLIAGPSGAGKTTWGMQTFVLEWQHGKDILGFKSYPVPWLYISCDRSLDSVHATMDRLRIPNDAFRKASAVDDGLHSLEKVLLAATQLTPKPEFLYLDGFLNLLPRGVHPNDNQSMAGWLADLTRLCKKDRITIMGSVHSPKMKKEDWYDNPRQRVAGGAAWAGFTDTIILVEPTSPDDASQAHHRRLMILPRNHKEITVELAFNDQGRLIQADDILRDDLTEAFLSTIKPGATFHVERMLTVLANIVSERTIYRLLNDLEEKGKVERISKGVYRKCHY